uniref:Wound-responsive family protein n=1 Tax=Kalanchoe fedtschenkoi TaxID=63787 RepID=A0A7N0V2D6_KALFE
MSYKAWVVATSIGAVEALKDQLGVCRWNYAIRSLQQHARNNIRSLRQGRRMETESGAWYVEKRAGRHEESFQKVMELSCWGPTTARF